VALLKVSDSALQRAASAPQTRGRDNVIVLYGVSWGDYQRLLEIRGERLVPRFTYLEGTLELMSPSYDHEAIKSSIARLVEAWCVEFGVEFSPVGSWTLEDKEVERGIEPDECYLLDFSEGQPAPKHRRPDLAIEVIWTSGSVNKLSVYSKLRVREVWIHQEGKLGVYVLVRDDYQRRDRSALLPALDLDLLLSFVDRHPVSRAVREYREALRSAPR
jgi:Uma2 family endonuclease